MVFHRMRWLPTAVIAATVLAGAGALTAAGASADTSLSSTVSLTVLEPAPGQVITGPTLPIQVLANGYRIDARYAGTPNLPSIGHYHEILDGNLVDMTPLVDGNQDAMPMVGVSDEWHTLTLVPANNDHSMIMSAAVSIPFEYEGPYLPEPAGYTGTGTPGVAITSPADGSTVQGGSFTMTVNATNFTDWRSRSAAAARSARRPRQGAKAIIRADSALTAEATPRSGLMHTRVLIRA